MKIPNKPLPFIWYSLSPYKKWFFWAVFFVILSQVIGASQAYVIKMFVDSANAYVNKHGSSNIVLFWLLAYPTLNLLTSLCWRANDYMMNYFTVASRVRAVKKLFEYISLHSVSYFNDNLSGALNERINTVSNNVSRLSGQFIWNILTLFSYIVSIFFVVYSSSHSIAYFLVGGLLVLIPVNFLLTRGQNKLSFNVAELSSKVRGQVVDSITNIFSIQQFSRRNYEILRLDKSLNEYRDADVKSDNFGTKVLFINNILLGLFSASVVYWSFSLWINGFVTVGTLVMIVNFLFSLSYAMLFVGQNFNEATRVYGEMGNGLRNIIKPHEITDAVDAEELNVAEGNIKFDGVAFAYSDEQKNIFRDLSFEVVGGQKIGIVGTSGAGKSTLMKLLLRQYDVSGGAVLIDGQNIKEVTQESLRENVAIVPQEPMLFHRTIRENIMYGKLDATEEEMIEVAKKAQAHDFIMNLPNKYDSLVGERGVKLSVGQRQRIAIARAFLKNAPILILDEATSALDSESEVAVQKALQTLMEGKTVFAIAHRLSTLREMDRILVFKEGQIVEDGTHQSLLRHKDGVYAGLWAHQAGGFIKEE